MQNAGRGEIMERVVFWAGAMSLITALTGSLWPI